MKLPAYKITKIEKFDWEPYCLADGGMSDPHIGRTTFYPLDNDHADTWARFFNSINQYKVTIVYPRQA